MSDKENGNDNLFCSFCGKSQREVTKLIAGPAVYICDECIQLCSEIIEEESEKEKSPEDSLLVPKEIKQKLDKDLRDAKEAGVTGTPTIFINGVKVKTRTLEAMQKLIDEKLGK